MADKRLFEQTLVESPTDLTQRLAYGKSGVATKNITLSGLIQWLESKLAFLKKSNNLSDLQSTSAARTNLNVYSKTEVYTKTEVDNIVNPIKSRFARLSVVGLWSIQWDGSQYIATAISPTSTPSFVVTRQATGLVRIVHGNGYAYIAFAQAFGFGGLTSIGKIAYADGYIEVQIHNTVGAAKDDNFHILLLEPWS